MRKGHKCTHFSNGAPLSFLVAFLCFVNCAPLISRPCINTNFKIHTACSSYSTLKKVQTCEMYSLNCIFRRLNFILSSLPDFPNDIMNRRVTLSCASLLECDDIRDVVSVNNFNVKLKVEIRAPRRGKPITLMSPCGSLTDFCASLFTALKAFLYFSIMVRS